jgi:hypothetical protein
MANLLDELQQESDNNANELSHDENGKYIPMDTDYIENLKTEVESKVNDFSELSIKRVKRRSRCIVDSYYTETFDPEPPKKPKRPATRRRCFLGRII